MIQRLAIGVGLCALLSLSACGGSGQSNNDGGGGRGGAGGHGGGAAGTSVAGNGGGAGEVHYVDGGAGVTGAAGAGSDGAAGTGSDGAAGTGATAGTSGTPDASIDTTDGGAPDGAAGTGGVVSPVGSPLALCGRVEECPASFSCVFGHCIADGAPAGYCRATGTACDSGFGCDDSDSLITFATRDRCAPAGAASSMCGYDATCADSLCLLTSSAPPTGTCVAPGTLRGLCRTTAPRCDTGLGCTAPANGTCATLTTTTACSATAGCPDGSECLNGACVATGTLTGLCRASAPECDGALVCGRTGRCSAVIPALGNCGGVGVCASGTSCVNGTCVTPGGPGAPCLDNGTCNANLFCLGDRICHLTAPRADGAVCASNDYCKYGSVCTLGLVCAPAGSARTPCGTAPGSASCAAGLTCTAWSNGQYCLDATQFPTAGMPCSNTAPCATGTTCVSASATSQVGTCLAPGALGGPCRTAAPGSTRCDAGLGCYGVGGLNIIQSCQPETLTAGMTCDASSSANHCVPGTTCANSVCIAHGKLGGQCRTHDPNGACDALLACNTTCASGIAEGATCSLTAGSPKCALPAICVVVAGSSTCARAGYTEQVVPTLPFVDACASGIHVPLKPALTVNLPRATSHASTPINLPFAFRFWGSDQTQVVPSTKGFLRFGPDYTNFVDAGFGNGYLPFDNYGPLIAPFWDDLLLGDPPASDICYAVTGTTPSRKFIVQWAHARRYGIAGSDLDFEVVLNEATQVVELVYRTLAPAAGASAGWGDGSRAAIGLQSGYDGVAVRHEGTAPLGGGLRYTPR